MLLLGYDTGSSSIKASLVDAEKGQCVASAYYPRDEMPMKARKPGWAEQEPEMWWKSLIQVTRILMKDAKPQREAIKGIGLSYQMHGLVLVDKNKDVLRPSIIWCDSRAVEIGDRAFKELGREKCLNKLLNSPGNFTASKLRWVRENEPEIYRKIYKILLPGDYIAMKMTGNIHTTVSGLSEGIFWDFPEHRLADFLLDHYEIDPGLLPVTVPTFSKQGELNGTAADELGLPEGIPVAYRAGDQPNNAFSLGVMEPGEIAATAGTSGVIYGISDLIRFDQESRVNSFAHLNHGRNKNRLGILLCINGTGILNSWLKNNIMQSGKDYSEMNDLAGRVDPGSNGLMVLPFGNGAERMLGNRETGCHLGNLNFNIHSKAHLLRAAQEGIVFSLNYGLDIMKSLGIEPVVIRAGNANMFLSSVFRNTLADLTGATIELYDTDGSAGAARGAGIGAGIYGSFREAFTTIRKVKTIEPRGKESPKILEAYHTWKDYLGKIAGNVQ